jgi:hypothetical protein
MDKTKKIQKRGNQTAFIISMIIILVLVIMMLYI